MDIIFMGTPEFAVPCLKMLVDKNYNVIAVVTKPDTKKGRGNKISCCEVAEFAKSCNLPVLQPEKVKNNEEFIEKIRKLNPDLIITCAYGKILPKEILDIPQYGCINVHASLLPKYRGASPINKAIMEGEKVSGVTTMYTDIGMDTGDILLSKSVQITDDMTASMLHDILSSLGPEVLEETLIKLQQHELVRVPQNNDEASYAGMMDKDTGRIDWNLEGIRIHNLVRGTNAWPVAFTYYKDQKLKVWKTTLVDGKTNKEPGTIIKVSKDGIDVATKDGIIRILEVQAPSKRRMNVCDYILGNKIEEGEVLWQGN